MTFAVTDDGKGSLSVERIVPAADQAFAFTFTNVYTVKGVDFTPSDSANVGIAMSKILTGRAMAAGEFSFALYEVVDGDEADEPASTGTSVAAADGKAAAITMTSINYTEAGEHTYRLREVVPSEGALGGVAYDDDSYTLTVSVTDGGQGQLVATTSAVDSSGKAVGEDTPGRAPPFAARCQENGSRGSRPGCQENGSRGSLVACVLHQ